MYTETLGAVTFVNGDWAFFHKQKMRDTSESGITSGITSAPTLNRHRRIRDANEKIPLANRVPASEFVVDEELRQLYRKRSEDAIALLRREMAFESEKHTIARDKLHNRFFAHMESNRVVLKVFSWRKAN